jgi:DNA-binding FadR family transcriptional regulator
LALIATPWPVPHTNKARSARPSAIIRAAFTATWGTREFASHPERAEAVAVLRRAVDDMDKWAASNLDDRIEADLRSHRTMCQLTGNEALLHQWSSLEGSIRMSIMFAGVERAIKNMNAKRCRAQSRRLRRHRPDQARLPPSCFSIRDLRE